MNHANDMAWMLAQGFQMHPWAQSERITRPMGETRLKQEMIIFSRQGLVLRVTVEDVDWEELSEEQLGWETCPEFVP